MQSKRGSMLADAIAPSTHSFMGVTLTKLEPTGVTVKPWSNFRARQAKTTRLLTFGNVPEISPQASGRVVIK